MEALETIVTWALLVAFGATIALAIKAILSKMHVGLSTTTAAPGVLGATAAFAVLATLLPTSAPIEVPFLFTLALALVAGLLIAWLIRSLVGANDVAGLGLAVLTAAAAMLAAILAGSPSKLVGFASVALVGVFVLGLMGFRSLPSDVARVLPLAGAAITFVGLFDWLQAKVGSPMSRMERLAQSSELESVAATVWAVILAVGGSTALFVLANLLFDRTDKKWSQFTAAAGATIGFIVFGLLDGNRAIQHLGPRDSVATNLHDLINGGFWSLLIVSIIIGSFIGYAAGYAIGVSRDDRSVPPMIGLAIGAGLGLIWGTLFAQRIPVDTSVQVLWNALTGAIFAGGLGYAIGRVDDVKTRAIIGTAGGAGIGLLLGGMLFNNYQPRLETVPLIAAPLILGAVGTGVNQLRGRNLTTGATTGALIGWLLGTFGFPKLGGGPEVETLVATGVAGGLAGLRYGAKPYLNSVGRVNLEQQSRGAIFLIPALSFIATGLVIPLMRTIVLSFKDERTVEWVGLRNYQRIFTDPTSFDYTGRLNLFGSVLFYVAAGLLILGLIGGIAASRRSGNTLGGSGTVLRTIGGFFILLGLLEYVLGRQTIDAEEQLGGNGLAIAVLVATGAAALVASFMRRGTRSAGARIDMAGAPGVVTLVGVFILSLAVFSTVRGTLFNNLWWVVTVTTLSAGFGLAVAVLADRASYENVAKSFIFMPLAISFVGAGIIWRFMYIARDERKDQTGVMNFIWVELGKISTGGTGRVAAIVVLLAILGGLAWLFQIGWATGAKNTAGSAAVVAVPFLWALYRFTVGGGMGGTGTVTDNGIIQDTTIQFLPDNQPFNNLWLMLVLIWIQTGFAMVIFSAAIKAVDTSLIEAAKIDGANDSQVFWKITVPQIVPTIGVVVTTLIVVVMKVFDIVKVMTNGNFDTQVVANEMWQRAFTELNFGLGSALAIVLFLAVVPVMTYNIRTMQKAL